MIREIELSAIRADTSAQPRASILTDKVTEYVERMTEGDAFPPMVVFFDGKINWLADGFHRYHAAIGIGRTNFPCDVRKGGLRDAVLFSCGANAAHGVPRTNEDKRRAVMKLLQDTEWSHWSDREIAKHAKVHHEMVGRLRPPPVRPVTGVSASEPRTFTTKHGTVAKMNTAAIGKRPAPVAVEQSEQPPAQPAPALQSASINPEAHAQHKRDLENGFISSAIWEVQHRIGGLPTPEEAAERFPRHHRHTITKASITEMSEWLRRFALAFTEEETSNVAAE